MDNNNNDKKKEVIELLDVLKRPLKAQNFSQFNDWVAKEYELLLKFILEVAMAPTKSKTTSVFIAWDNLSEIEQARLTEFFSKRQLILIGFALCAYLESRNSGMQSFFGQFMDDIGKRRSELEDDTNDPDKI